MSLTPAGQTSEQLSLFGSIIILSDLEFCQDR